MSMSIRLQELRKNAQLSQEELAERIGVSSQAISNWENEQSNPEIENIVQLSGIFGTSTDYILKGTQPTIIQTSKNSEYAGAFKALIVFGGIVAIILLAFLILVLAGAVTID